MAKASPAADKRINRRIVLKAGAALAAAGPLLRGGHAEAQPRANRATALFAYVGAFTTPERKGHGGGINVYRVDPASGAWTHERSVSLPAAAATAARRFTPSLRRKLARLGGAWAVPPARLLTDRGVSSLIFACCESAIGG